MKFFDKLNSLLEDGGIREKNLFNDWLSIHAQLEHHLELVTAEYIPDQIAFDVSKLSASDLKKLVTVLMLPEDTVAINNQVTVSERFLCAIILPQFENYLKTLPKETTEIPTSGQIIENVDDEFDEIENDFIIIESGDVIDEADYYTRYPWKDSKHPLYFPATQPMDSTSLTRWEAVDKFSVENWYPHLQEYTFASCFFALNQEDIQFLIGNGSVGYDSTQLEHTFDKLLSQFRNQEVFMRLSTRSPKDSKSLFDEAATIMSKDFTYWRETDNKNQQLVSFVASMAKSMKITSGKKIIEMIQGSPRVQNDFFALLNSESTTECTTNVVMREWYTIRPDHEFRLFVSRRCREESIVTAISQYFHFLYFDQAPADCFNFLDETTKNDLILKFQNYVLKSIDPKVATFLNFSSEQDGDNSINCIREYIVDLALIPFSEYKGEVSEENTIKIGESTYILLVIELNPFAPSATGCALFNWETDLERLWGKASCDYPLVKFRSTPREDLSTVTLLPVNYEHVIEHALSKRVASRSSVDLLLSPSVPQTNQSNRFFTIPSQHFEETSYLNTVDEDLSSSP